MKPSLLVLAAGMGSRYGSLKQMDAFGPNGETIIDYSIYDAIQAGFGKVVFVIREHFKDAFQTFFDKKLQGRIEVEYVTQELDKIPEGLSFSKDREKPWGTAHAVMMGAEVIDGPFAVINADDYYGKPSYKTLVDFFQNNSNANTYSVVGYYLRNTLSKFGTVNRGVCFKDDKGNLSKVVECTKIKRDEDGIPRYPNEEGGFNTLEDSTLVSMNMWGFTPSYFDYFKKHFSEFVNEHGNELKSEYYIPKMLDTLINLNEITINVLESDSEWFGVTYKDDKPYVMDRIKQLIDKGAYPENLWM